METIWKIVFEGYWIDIRDSLRPFETMEYASVIDWNALSEQVHSFDHETGYGCAHLSAPNLSFALGIIQATKKSVKTYLSCEMRGNGIQAYACFGDSDEHVYNEIITAQYNPELTKKLRKIQGDIEDILSKRQE